MPEPKPNEQLTFRDTTTYIVESMLPSANERGNFKWSSNYWSVFKKTLEPFADHKDRAPGGNITFTTQDTAVKAAHTIKAMNPDERIRIIKRHTVITEELIEEVH